MTDALTILHRDDDLVVVSKPGGMAVHRGMGVPRTEPFVLQTLSSQIGQYIYPVHRLDRPTSGVLAFALSSEMATALHSALKQPESIKEYIVLCRGTTPEAFVCDRALKGNRDEMLEARSEFVRLGAFERCSLLQCQIATGRYHQIRRHLSHLAHQVIGDSSRGKGRINRFFKDTYGLPRMFLHARRLRIAHPRHGAPLELVDPLPQELCDFLLRLPEFDASLLKGL